MQRGWLLIVLVLFAACATGPSPDEINLPPPSPDFPPVQSSPGDDARIAQLQTSMTELLERLDVLNDRLAKLEAVQTPVASLAQPGASPVPVPAPVSGTAPRQSAAPKDIYTTYRNALVLYGKARWSDARALFQQVFDAEPTGELADNALYWIGDTYYAAGDYTNAMRFYARVTKDFPNENKAPDALFKIGLAYEKSGDLAMARKTFEECIRKYPYATPAASAKVELSRIKY